MTIVIDTSSGWVPNKTSLDAQQQAVLDILVSWARRQNTDEVNTHWVRGFAGSGKTILIIYAMLQTIAILRSEGSDKTVCFITYTFALKDLVLSALQSEDGEEIPVFTFYEFEQIAREQGQYDFAFVDEAQDIRPNHLNLIKRKCKKIVIAGDPHQSIYEKALKIETTTKELAIRDQCQYSLSILYRLPPRVVEFANKILPNDQMVFAENGYIGNPGDFIVTHYANDVDEVRMVFQTASDLAKSQAPSLIILPNHKAVYSFARNVCEILNKTQPPRPSKSGPLYDYTAFNQSLENSQIPLSFFGSNNGDLEISKLKGHTFLMTYHSSKGLDFKNVFLPTLNVGQEFWKDDEDLSQALFFVGLTRTSRNLYLSFTSEKPHRYVEKNYPTEKIVDLTDGNKMVEAANAAEGANSGYNRDIEDPF